MYFYLKAAVRGLLLPPSGPLILAIVGALMMWRRRRFGGVLLALGLGSLWLLATPIVAFELCVLAEHYPPLDLSKPTNAQAIVVIGGGGQVRLAPEYQDSAATDILLEKLTFTAFVARRTGLPILVSGAPAEAVIMRTSLSRDFGLSTRWLEDQSRDTFENARLSAKMLQPAGVRRIILVTNSTHLWRATHEFQDAGFDVVPAPAGVWVGRQPPSYPFIPNAASLMRASVAVYEIIGEAGRRLQEALGVRERLDEKVATG